LLINNDYKRKKYCHSKADDKEICAAHEEIGTHAKQASID